VSAEHSICTLTGQPFMIAAVRTAGFKIELCPAGGEHPSLPAPGSIIGGTVILVATLDAQPP